MRSSVPRRSLVRRLSGQIWQACQRWNNAECVDLSAAFAYFVLQSFFPLLLIALSVAARVFGKTDSVDNVLASVTQVLPPSATSLVDSTLRGLVDQGFGAGVLGVVVLLLTASNAYLTLHVELIDCGLKFCLSHQLVCLGGSKLGSFVERVLKPF